MKALSTSLVIVITAIVVLITALVILSVFSGGIQNVNAVLSSWLGGGQGQPADPCIVACKAYCIANPAGTTPYSALPGCNKSGTCNCAALSGG